MAKNQLGELYWKITGDNTSFDSSLTQSENGIKNFGKSAGKFVAGAGAAIGAVFVAAGTAAFKLAKDAGVAADQLLDLEQVTGLSTDTLQELKFISAEAGVSFEGLTGAATKFSAKIPQIEAGTGEAAEAFNKLGVDLRDASGELRSQDELFPEIIESLQGIENVTERNSTAQQLFGRSLGDLAPVLGIASDEFNALREEANEVGAVLSVDALNAANTFRASLDTLSVQSESTKTAIGATLAPIFQSTLIPALESTNGQLTTLANNFTEFTQSTEGANRIAEIAGTITGGFAALGELAAPILDSLKTGLDNIIEPFQTIQTETKEVGLGFTVLGGAISVLSNGLNLITTIAGNAIQNIINLALVVKETGALVADFGGVLTGSVRPAELKESLAEVGDSFRTLGEGIATGFVENGRAVLGFFSNVGTDATEAADAAATAFEESFNRTAEAVSTGLASNNEAFEETGEAAEESAEVIVDAYRGATEEQLLLSAQWRDDHEQTYAAAEQNLQDYIDRQKLVEAGIGALTSGFTAVGEALVAGELNWKSFARVGLESIAALLEALGAQMAAYAAAGIAAAYFTAGTSLTGVGPAAAGSAAAYAAAGVLRGLAANFNSGGIVQGAPSTVDTVPAMLTPGEEVITEDDPRHTNNFSAGTVFNILLDGDMIGKKVVNDYINTGVYTIDARGLR